MIPISTKEDFRENFDEIVVNHLKKEPHHLVCTSGSTGQPFEFFADNDYGLNERASFLLAKKYWGCKINSKENVLMIQRLRDYHKKQPNAITKVKEFFFGKVLYSEAHEMNLESTKRLLNKIQSVGGIDTMYSFSSTLVAFARSLEALDVRISIPITISIGESMPNSGQELIEEYLGTKLYRDYSSAECMRMGFESKENPGFYFMDTYNYFFEMPDSDDSSLIVTNLNNKIFPIIRYEIGDSGNFLTNYKREKGINLPLAQIKGRVYDFIRTPLGKDLTVHFFTYVFEYKAEYVSQFQVNQIAKDKISIDVVTRKNMPDLVVNDIVKEIREYTENSMDISLKMVNRINTEVSGKRKLLIGLKDE